MFQCWQITDCPVELREACNAFLHHEYRFWRVVDCKLSDGEIKKARENLSKVIELENA